MYGKHRELVSMVSTENRDKHRKLVSIENCHTSWRDVETITNTEEHD